MFTVSFVLREKDGMSRADAQRYWREEHAAIAKSVPGARRYVQQHAVGAPEGEPPFLGIGVLTFDDQEAFATAAGSPEFAAAVADVANFADAQMETAFVEEIVIVG